MTQGCHGGITGVTFRSDGHQLVGVLYLAPGHAPKPTALLLHGCPGLEKNTDIAAELRDRGWNSLIFHYRGCWGSAGPYDLGTLSRDIRAAVDYLAGAPWPGVDPSRLVVIGHSMGGWAAILAAADDARLRAAAALAAPVAPGRLPLSDADLEREFTRFLATTPAELRSQLSAANGRPGPADVIGKISPRPVLIVHGSADEWVPADDGRRLHERSRAPCRYAEIEGANHSFTRHRTGLRDLVTGWLLQETGV
jgi:dipeptidyl aminopeptidase/acylaminoacyl peptidase